MDQTALLDRGHAGLGPRRWPWPPGPAHQRKAGVLNLGAEGMMLVPPSRLRRAFTTGSDTLAFVAGAAAGGLLAAAFGALVILAQHQPVRHRAGRSACSATASRLRRVGYVGQKLSEAHALRSAGAGQIPSSGGAVPPSPDGLHRHVFDRRDRVVFSIAARRAWCCARWASRRIGDALGYKVRWIRLLAVVAAARCAASRAPSCRWSMRRCGWRAGGGAWLDRAVPLTTLPTGGRCACCSVPTCSAASRMAQFALQGAGRQLLQPAAGDAAVHRHHRGAGPDQPQPDMDPHQMPASLGKPFHPGT